MSKISNDQQPPKRVKVTLACALCRKKKVKCDGIQPSCSRCKSIGNCCQYSEPPKKRGPPKGYVEVIENRAHRIESLLGNQQQQQQQQQLHHHHFNTNENSSNFISSSFAHVSVDNNMMKENVIQSNLNQVIVKENYQSVNPLLCLISEAVDAVNKTASNNIVHGSHGIMYDFTVTSNVLFPISTITTEEEEHISSIMSDNGLSFTWTENFFSQFNFMFPILSKPQFASQLENCKLNSILKLAVFTLGCRLENNHDHLYQEKLLYKQFLTVSHDVLLLVPDLCTIQAIAVMCWYTYIIGDMHKCYSLRHQLSQLINKSNFGYESDNSNDIHFNEMKRRAFWVSFVIDQLLASCTGGERMLVSPISQPWDCKYPQLEDNQLFALHYQQQKQQKPSFINNTSYFSIESALQINSFNEMIKLSKIVADMCSSNTNNNNNNLESKLTEWLLHLPSYLDYGKPTNNEEPSPIAKLYRILYYTVQIMLNNNNSNNNKNGIITSICTTAANSIIHISEQMVEKGQQKYLYNVFFVSLTLATSIYLDNTIEKVENTPDRMSLHKSISMIKDVNCTLLSPIDFDRLMDHFLTDRCRLLLDNTNAIYPSPTNSSTILPSRNNNNKRTYPDDEDDCQSTLFMNSPSSLNSSINDIQDALSIVDYTKPFLQNQSKEEFDLNDLLFPNIMDTLQQDSQQWPEWIFDNQQSLESSTTTTTACSPSSNITPSNSPSLSLCQKDENSISFDILSNQHFFTSFPLL